MMEVIDFCRSVVYVARTYMLGFGLVAGDEHTAANLARVHIATTNSMYLHNVNLRDGVSFSRMPI
jgi:hypothetical protein